MITCISKHGLKMLGFICFSIPTLLQCVSLSLGSIFTWQRSDQEDTERVVTERDILDITGIAQHMLCTDGSQFLLEVYHRRLTKPVWAKQNKAEVSRGLYAWLPSSLLGKASPLYFLQCISLRKKDSSVTQLTLTCSLIN